MGACDGGNAKSSSRVIRGIEVDVGSSTSGMPFDADEDDVRDTDEAPQPIPLSPRDSAALQHTSMLAWTRHSAARSGPTTRIASGHHLGKRRGNIIGRIRNIEEGTLWTLHVLHEEAVDRGKTAVDKSGGL
jgi:hypothetical protein